MKFVRVGCPHCQALLEVPVKVMADDAISDGLVESQDKDGATLRCGACERKFPRRLAVEPPVQPSPISAATLGTAEHSGSSDELDRVLIPAIALLKTHIAALLCVSLIVNLIWLAVVGFPASFLVDQWKMLLDGQTAGLAVMGSVLTATFVVGMMVAPVSAYGMIVIARLTLRIARYGDHERVKLAEALRELLVPLTTVLQTSVLLIAIGLILAAILVGGLALTIALSFVTDPQSATTIGVFVLGTSLIACVFLLQWLMWLGIFLIADERATCATALSWGSRLARQHRKLSVSLITIYFILSTLGSLLFYVGQVVSVPVAMLPMALGYLRMTGGQRRGTSRNRVS